MGIPNDLAPLKGKRVVLADHHSNSRAALREMVSLLGCTTIVNATNANDVVRQAKARQLDMILCDYQLDGERDGQQLLEELRHTKQIPLATMFMMITGERSYQKVVAVAEFAPDDYLLKPFTANQLMERIGGVAIKKNAFAQAYVCMEHGKLELALTELKRVRTAYPQFAADALRLSIETLLTLERHQEAEAILQEVMAKKLVPWAAMGLARIQIAEKNLDAAEANLTAITERHPEYLGARDLLAQVKEELGKPEEALAILESAGAGAQHNVSRLRQTGNLAALTGDHKKASHLLEKVVGRVRNSSLARAEDFVALADSYIQQGRTADAERVSLEQRRTMRDSPEALLVSKLMEFQRYCRDPSAAAQERANEALDAVLAARIPLAETPEVLTANVEFDILNACFQNGRFEEAVALGEALRKRDGLSARLEERTLNLLSQIRTERARIAAIVPIDQVVKMLTRLLARGWDDAVGHSCRASVAHWGSKTPDDAYLPEARQLLASVLRKYGFDTEAAEAPA